MRKAVPLLILGNHFSSGHIDAVHIRLQMNQKKKVGTTKHTDDPAFQFPKYTDEQLSYLFPFDEEDLDQCSDLSSTSSDGQPYRGYSNIMDPNTTVYKHKVQKCGKPVSPHVPEWYRKLHPKQLPEKCTQLDCQCPDHRDTDEEDLDQCSHLSSTSCDVEEKISGKPVSPEYSSPDEWYRNYFSSEIAQLNELYLEINSRIRQEGEAEAESVPIVAKPKPASQQSLPKAEPAKPAKPSQPSQTV